MIEPNKTAVTVFLVEVRPVARQDMGMQVDFQGKCLSAAQPEAYVPIASRAENMGVQIDL